MHIRRPVTLLAAAATPLLLGAAEPQQAVPDFTCSADDQQGGPHRALPLPGQPWSVAGRLSVVRKKDTSSAEYAASANVQIMSADNQTGVYLIVAGEEEFMGESVLARLVQIRDGKRREHYDIGLFKATATLRFTLTLDDKGVATAQVGSRKVKLRADPLTQAKAVFGCSLGTFTFSGVTLGGV